MHTSGKNPRHWSSALPVQLRSITVWQHQQGSNPDVPTIAKTHIYHHDKKTSTRETPACKTKSTSPVLLERETEQLPVRVERAGRVRGVHLERLGDGVLPEVVRVGLGKPEVDLDVGDLASGWRGRGAIASRRCRGVHRLPSRCRHASACGGCGGGGDGQRLTSPWARTGGIFAPKKSNAGRQKGSTLLVLCIHAIVTAEASNSRYTRYQPKTHTELSLVVQVETAPFCFFLSHAQCGRCYSKIPLNPPETHTQTHLSHVKRVLLAVEAVVLLVHPHDLEMHHRTTRWGGRRARQEVIRGEWSSI